MQPNLVLLALAFAACSGGATNLVNGTSGGTTGGTSTGGTTTTGGTSGGTTGCRTGADCPSGCCAPVVNAGIVTGVYACKSDRGQAFECCPSVGVPQQGCPAGYFCSGDVEGNTFCSKQCFSDAACGNSGVACCDTGCNGGGSCCGVCGK
jgi:hypothetical protein